MKKKYFTPEINFVDIKCLSYIATGSVGGDIEIDKDGPGGEEQLSNKNKGSWGNIWEQ